MDSREETVSVTGGTGLALLIGELRAEQRHDREEHAREMAELRSEQAERFEALEAARDEDRALINDMRGVIEQLVAVVEKQVPNTGGNKRKDSDADTRPTLPTRRNGEKSQTLHARAVEWAEEHGVTPPPKPSNFDTAREYDRKLASWGQQLPTQ
jgi:hypothetical protein